MGYDMYVVTGVNEKGFPGTEGFLASQDDNLYLRRSIGWMGNWRRAMFTTGAMFRTGIGSMWGSDGDGSLNFPNPKEYGLTENEETYQYEGPRLAEFEAELLRVLRYHGPETPGIPDHKVSDNSGWWVTKIECQAAYDLIQQWLTEHGYTQEDITRAQVFFDDDPTAEADADEEQMVLYELADTLPFLDAARRAHGFEVD